MESRERVLRAINLEEPDRVPIDIGGPVSSITKIAYDNLTNHLGLKMPESVVWDKMQQLACIDERILKTFHVDTRHIQLNPPGKDEIKQISEDSFINEFGVTLKKVGYFFEIVGNPLSEAVNNEDIENHSWPKPHEGRTKGLREKAKRLYEEGYAVIADAFTGGIFEVPQWLRGFRHFYYDLAGNPEISNALMDKMLETHKDFWDAYLDEVGDYVQIVCLGDDYGMQDRMLISPRMFRETIKPRVKELYSFIKRKAKVKIFHHSCGSIRPILNDLADMGVDILNPVQPRAKDMVSEEIKKEHGDKLCFHGGVDIQHVLPKGSPGDVEEEVKKRIKAFAPGGGYIAAPAHNIQPDVPPQNILALYKAVYKHGKYSLNLEMHT